MSAYPSHRHPDLAPLGQPRPLTGEAEFIASWLGHYEAGRLGNRNRSTPEQLASLKANELALLGHTPSFPPEPRPRPAGLAVPIHAKVEG